MTRIRSKETGLRYDIEERYEESVLVAPVDDSGCKFLIPNIALADHNRWEPVR